MQVKAYDRIEGIDDLGRYTVLTRDDVGRSFVTTFGKARDLTGVMGPVQPIDVGKRLYIGVDDVLQVENDEQRAGRTGPDATFDWAAFHDDVQRHAPGSKDDAWLYIHKHQGQSVDWACKHEGWSIRRV
jgi:hypothetical protein